MYQKIILYDFSFIVGKKGTCTFTGTDLMVLIPFSDIYSIILTDYPMVSANHNPLNSS